jgi:hypothetical protein
VRWIVLLAAAAGLSLWAAEPPEQPIPFSHNLHVGAVKLQCKMCHPNPDPGESMTIAPIATCMQCHTSIKKDSPAIQKLAQYAAEGKQVPWVRVYQVPSFVYYSHRQHLNAKAVCSDCHANVAESEKVSKEGDISMGACMTCHQMRKARFDCHACHDLRQ